MYIPCIAAGYTDTRPQSAFDLCPSTEGLRQAHLSAVPRGSAPWIVAERLVSHVTALQWRKRDVPMLRARFDAHAPVNYDRLAETFTYQYLLANYWKAFFSIADAEIAPPRAIADLGAGSGAATAAALAWCSLKRPSPSHIDVVLVDRSTRQLALAMDLIMAAVQALPGLTVDLHTMEETIVSERGGWTESIGSCDLTLASHFLTENITDARKLADLIVESGPRDGHLLIVERPDDEVWDQIPCGWREIEIPSAGLPANGYSDPARSSSLRTRYCLLPTLGGSVMRHLIALYFQAWQEQSVDQLDDVFATDATYQDKPTSEPIRSLDGIREYWRRRVVPQREPRPRVLRCIVGHSSAHVVWEAELTLGSDHKLVSGVMDLELDRAGDRIGRLSESYSSRSID